MNIANIQYCTAFSGSQILVQGPLAEVAAWAKKAIDGGIAPSILIFDDASAQLVEVDFRGTVEDVLTRITSHIGDSNVAEPVTDQMQARGPGRPKLGVVAREVTLLPRHWDWLNSQQGGASVAIRKLVEDARRANAGKDLVRISRETAYRFMSAMAGNESGFEEAARALFAGNQAQFDYSIRLWPTDLRDYSKKLATGAFVEA